MFEKKSRKNIRVFVVDDDSLVSSTLGLILSQAGFNATSFTNPYQAVSLAEHYAPDLLICDILMPEMTGIHLASYMRMYFPGCRILLLSGQPKTARLVEQARVHGESFELLMKPIDPVRLIGKLDKLMLEQSKPRQE